MAVDEPPRTAASEISQARLCVAASRQIISRSNERIANSVRAMTRVPGEFALPAANLTDEQLLTVAEAGQAETEQREISREVRQTLKDWPLV